MKPPQPGALTRTADTTRATLRIGLNPYRVPGPWDPKPVAEAIEAGMRKFAEHGLSAQSCLVGLDGLGGQDDSEGMVIAALQSHA